MYENVDPQSRQVLPLLQNEQPLPCPVLRDVFANHLLSGIDGLTTAEVFCPMAEAPFLAGSSDDVNDGDDAPRVGVEVGLSAGTIPLPVSGCTFPVSSSC